MEYWYRPTVMTVLLKHKIESAVGFKIYKNILSFPDHERDIEKNSFLRLLLYQTLTGLTHCAPDLHLFHVALVEFTKGMPNQLEYIQKLIHPLKLFVTTFTKTSLIQMAKILSWSSLLNWHFSLAKKSLDWATAIALTWCSFVNQIDSIDSIIPSDKEKISTVKETLVQFTVNIFMNAPPENNIYTERNPTLDPLGTLLHALLCNESPPKLETARSILYRVPVIFKHISLPFFLIEKISELLVDYNLFQFFTLFPVHSLLGEIQFAVSNLHINQINSVQKNVLKQASASYLSRSQIEYSYRTIQHNGCKISSHEGKKKKNKQN